MTFASCPLNTLKPVNKGHPSQRQCMVFVDKRPLFKGYTVLFNQGKVTEVWPFLQGGLYLEVAFITGLTVLINYQQFLKNVYKH